MKECATIVLLYRTNSCSELAIIGNGYTELQCKLYHVLYCMVNSNHYTIVSPTAAYVYLH